MKRYKTILMALLAGMLIVNGCEDEGPDIDVESSIPVRVEAVAFKPINEFSFATGTVYAVNDALLKAVQSGYYQLNINPRTNQTYAMGDPVMTGDVIVTLKNPEFENQVAFDSKKLNHQTSKREYEKQKSIYEKGGITLRELTDAERLLIDARYSYDNAVIQLTKMKMIAPFDGILVDLPFFGANKFIEAGEILARVMDYTLLFSEITLPGKEMGRVEKGQDVLVSNYNNPGDTLKGKVAQVSPTLNAESRMFKATLEINNPDLILRPGMFVKADIVVSKKDSALVIPKEIILVRRGEKLVFVVDKGIAVERKLETGLSNRFDIEILSGLKEDDRLVVEGFETLRHRSKVKVTK